MTFLCSLVIYILIQNSLSPKRKSPPAAYGGKRVKETEETITIPTHTFNSLTRAWIFERIDFSDFRLYWTYFVKSEIDIIIQVGIISIEYVIASPSRSWAHGMGLDDRQNG